MVPNAHFYTYSDSHVVMTEVVIKEANLLRLLSWKASEKLTFLLSSTKAVVFSNIQVAALWPGAILSTPRFSK